MKLFNTKVFLILLLVFSSSCVFLIVRKLYEPQPTVYLTKFHNAEFGYSFEPTNVKLGDLFELPPSDSLGYIRQGYCYSTNDTVYKSDICGEGFFPIFDINIMTEEQYKSRVLESPIGEQYHLLAQDDNYYYTFGITDGPKPHDFPDRTFYETIKNTFSLN